jgi:hypothetical protein
MINKIYLESQKLIKKQFDKEGIIVLFEVLTAEDITRINAELSKIKWKINKNILSHSYSTAPLTPTIKTLVSSLEFKSFITSLLHQKTSSFKFELILYNWKDYTILNDTIEHPREYDIVLDFTTDWDAKAGGSVIYTDGTGNYIKLPIQKNLMAVINRRIQPNRYTQYCNHYGKKGKRILMIGTKR